MTTTQLTTQDLVDMTCEAIMSLDLQSRLKPANPGDHVYFLTEDKYTEIYALGDDTCTPDLSGRDYPASRDIQPFNDFVFQGLKDEHLWGFVPLTDEAKKLLELNSRSSGIDIITIGERIITRRPVDEKRVSYNLYH
jgi:hypothetical protein